ncbi:hypothetical protein M378DRAFT_158942, partial [Amanita muscaria Koide BX008]
MLESTYHARGTTSIRKQGASSSDLPRTTQPLQLYKFQRDVSPAILLSPIYQIEVQNNLQDVPVSCLVRAYQDNFHPIRRG